MRITTLIENKPFKTNPHLVSEWGLSLHIMFNDHNILFDTGASASFAKNAEHLSIDIGSINAAILSHHHHDHGGGLRRFLELNSNAKVYLGKIPDGDCVRRGIFGFMDKDVGLDKALMAEHTNRFVTVSEPVQILPDVFILPHISGNYPKPTDNKRIFLRKNGSLTPDNFVHEIVMAIKENGKLVLFTGCSHSGILNMIDTVAREFKGDPIRALIGGFHLMAAGPFNLMGGRRRKVEDLARSILNYPVEMTYTGHCTGTKAYKVLKAVMGERIMGIRTGTCFEV